MPGPGFTSKSGAASSKSRTKGKGNGKGKGDGKDAKGKGKDKGDGKDSKGKGKAESYVLVSYELDYDLPIPKNTFSFENVIKAVHFSVLDDCAVAWSGEATDSNSASTGKIHVNSVDEYRKSISLGSVEPKIKWCKCLREDIAQHRGLEIEAA
jgi:hypothetical protein